jgi:hypothetical protein
VVVNESTRFRVAALLFKNHARYCRSRLHAYPFIPLSLSLPSLMVEARVSRCLSTTEDGSGWR